MREIPVQGMELPWVWLTRCCVAPLQNNPFARPFIEALDGMGLSQDSTPFDNGMLCLHKDVLMTYLVNLRETVQGYAS